MLGIVAFTGSAATVALALVAGTNWPLEFGGRSARPVTRNRRSCEHLLTAR
ncbi:hypothetical protein ACVGOW_17675 [Pseudonocardia saturnea]